MSDESQKFEEREYKFLISYVDLIPLRAIIQSIPTVGPIIDSFLAWPGEIHNNKRMERLECLFNFLKDSLSKMEEEKINKEWITTDEFYDILIRVIDSTIKTRSMEKILLYSMILSNVITVQNDGRFRPEEYLSALEDLTPLEVKALLVFYREFNNYTPDPTKNELQNAREIKWREALQKECGIDREDIDFIVKRLERTGFIKEITGVYYDYVGGEYTITESFKRFCEYLSKHPFSKDFSFQSRLY